MSYKRLQFLVCKGTGCVSSDSAAIIDRLNALIKEKDLSDVSVVQTGCFGFCGEGPIVKVMPDNVFYIKVKPSDCDDLINAHAMNGDLVQRLLYEDPITHAKIKNHKDMQFYEKQTRIALKNCGILNPEDINEYIAADGYRALYKVLKEMTPQDVIEEIKKSGLRGRGGGGFPTGIKWEITAKEKNLPKYIFCNADEGDPGAFMDRSILEGDPNSIIEAMAIGGYATGANTGIVYIRAEYPLAITRLKIAIEQARALGLLGYNIFNSGFDFDIKIKLGAGAFVCGEETALIHSVEGSRGEPTSKPPFPSQSGYLGQPTTVNNVETYANIPRIILNGSDWFSKIGTENSKGTKVFALAGKVNNVGLVEVPMGITLSEIVYDIGGGIPDGKEFKAVQIGGPSGGVITKENLFTPIDYEHLKEIGTMMGSGGLIVMDDDNDMVEIAKFYLEFTQDESCGRCTPCRIGTKRLLEMLQKLTGQESSMEELGKMKLLCETIKDTAACGLGQTAPNPVLSTMKYFPEEYERYAKKQVRTKYHIDAQKCKGCTKCARVCPVRCITGKVKQSHIIDESKCISCGSCYTACNFDAVVKP